MCSAQQGALPDLTLFPLWCAVEQRQGVGVADSGRSTEADRECDGAADTHRRPPGYHPRELRRAQAHCQNWQRLLHFCTGQWRPEAVMHAATERQLGGALRADVERGGTEDPWVGVGGGSEHGEKGARRDPQAFKLEVLGGDPPDGRDCWPYAHDLLDRAWRECGFCREPRPLGRVLEEYGQRTAQLIADGVLAPEHQQRHHGPELLVV